MITTGTGIRRITAGLAGAVWLALALAAVSGGAAAEPLRLGYRTWVSVGPLFIAAEKGWFAQEGVEVELVPVEDDKVRSAALATGGLDAMVAMVDATVRHLTPKAELRFVFALADSRGGDGLVALQEITTIARLKRSTVAVDPGSTGQFYLNLLLHEAGLTEGDVTVVPLAPGAAGYAFETGEVDAAVTWEPWLTRTRKRNRGHVLADTERRPGLLIEAVVAPAVLLRERETEFAALYRAWLRAVAFAAGQQEEANVIMAAGLGRWLRHRGVVEEMRLGIAWYDAAANAALFGGPGRPGPLTDRVAQAIDIWDGFGKLQVRVLPRDMISYATITQ